jgi:NAD(P)H-dependent FMN reductase
MYVPVILGTAREGRQSENAAAFVVHKAIAGGIEAELIDVRTYLPFIVHEGSEGTVPVRDAVPAMQELAAKFTRADAFIIVTPEYNHGYPGSLKLLLDSFRDVYTMKPVGLCGVSSGTIGGARVVEALKPVLVDLQLVPIRTAVYFQVIGKLFDAAGNITDPTYHERVKAFLGELTQYATALTKARTA